MSQLPAMPVWWGDFFSKTDHLSNEEQWAYAKLMAKTWMRNCRPLPDSAPDLARLLGLTVKRWLKIRERIAPFFDLSDGTWRQENLEKQFAFVAERAGISHRNGALGGRPKGNKNNTIENPAGSIQVTQEEPTQTHTHTHREKKAPPTPRRGAGVIDLEFEVWWKEVPRKIGRGQAQRAHRQARKKVEAQVLLDGIKAYASSRAGEDERYTVHPATWLNGERWLDAEPVEAEPMRSRPTGPPPRPEDIWPDFKAMGAAH